MKFRSNNINFRGARNMCLVVLLLFAYIVLPKNASAQSCATTVPAYTLNFTGHPDTTWTSPSIKRNGLCCGRTGSDECILFYITLDSLSSGIVVDAVGGLGATDYELNCDTSTTTALGNRTCIANTGRFYVTICKPGNNAQQYTVTSIPKPYIEKDPVYISPGCPTKLHTIGLQTSSITWASVSGSIYNSNLSCTSGCAEPVVTPTANFPDYVDYKVCGTPINTTCFGTSYCDTVRVYYYQKLNTTITPGAAYVCTGSSSSVKVTASASGGKAPYSYKWNNGSTDSAITVGAGTYIVSTKDALGCQVAKDTVVVTAAAKPTPSITGSSIICVNEEGTYFVMPQSNRSYSWDMNGGIVATGSGTNMISVVWTTTGTKTVSVTETNTLTGCFTTATKSVTVHPRPTINNINH